MNRKKLPRAIMRTGDDLPAATPAGDAVGVLGDCAQAPNRLRGASDFRRTPDQDDNVVAMMPGSPALSVRGEGGSALPARPPVAIDATHRRSRALAIVDRHAAYSAFGGIIPLPLANFAGVTTVIVRMVKVLSDHYGVAFKRDRAHAIVVGLVGGVMPTGVAAVTTSALFYILPPSILLGLAVSSVTAAAFTRSIGRIFIEQFERGAILDDFPAVGVR
jgi:uncharacterized protein (DUF697 family)